MDNPAALHRIQVGVPATVEHSSEAGPETGKRVAETTQVHKVILALHVNWPSSCFPEFYYIYGRVAFEDASKGPATSYLAGTDDKLCAVFEKQGLGRPKPHSCLVCLNPISSKMRKFMIAFRLIALNAMKASEEISEEQARQVCFASTPSRCCTFLNIHLVSCCLIWSMPTRSFSVVWVKVQRIAIEYVIAMCVSILFTRTCISYDLLRCKIMICSNLMAGFHAERLPPLFA